MIFRSYSYDLLENFKHPVDDATYYDMVCKNSREEVNKSVLVGQVFEINSVTVLSDNMIIVSGSGTPSISVKMAKEKEFLKSISMNSQEFIDSIAGGSGYYIKIVSTESGLRGSFAEAKKDILQKEFFEQLKSPTKVYEAKIMEKNRGGYFVNIHGVDAFLPGSLASANKIINFEAFLGKTVKVMLDSYINDSDTFIVSNKRYIDHVLPEMIEKIDISVKYQGSVTGTIQSGIFIEFNEIMTGLLSQQDMSPETLEKFKSGSIRPGDRIDIWIRDIIPPKNFMLTENSTEDLIASLSELNSIIEREETDIITAAKVVSIKGPFVTLEFSGVMSTISLKGSMSTLHRIKIGSNVKIRISSIEPRKNRVNGIIITENESNN